LINHEIITYSSYFDFGKLDKDADILSPIRNGEVRRGARWQDGKMERWQDGKTARRQDGKMAIFI
jgi:hypothetical protein